MTELPLRARRAEGQEFSGAVAPPRPPLSDEEELVGLAETLATTDNAQPRILMAMRGLHGRERYSGRATAGRIAYPRIGERWARVPQFLRPRRSLSGRRRSACTREHRCGLVRRRPPWLEVLRLSGETSSEFPCCSSPTPHPAVRPRQLVGLMRGDIRRGGQRHAGFNLEAGKP